MSGRYVVDNNYNLNHLVFRILCKEFYIANN